MTAPIFPAAVPGSIERVARCLADGGIAVIPTDTVYGLAASVFDDEAIVRVFETKRRRPTSAVPVLLASAADLPLLVAKVPATAWKLIDRFWPGPLTLVLRARPSTSQVLTAGRRTVAVRVPAANSCLRLLETVGIPLVGTSANVSGEPAARTAEEALGVLGTSVDMILEDDGAIGGSLPSTVVDLTEEHPVVHRIGALAPEAVRQVTGGRVIIRGRLTDAGPRG